MTQEQIDHLTPGCFIIIYTLQNGQLTNFRLNT